MSNYLPWLAPLKAATVVGEDKRIFINRSHGIWVEKQINRSIVWSDLLVEAVFCGTAGFV